MARALLRSVVLCCIHALMGQNNEMMKSPTDRFGGEPISCSGRQLKTSTRGQMGGPFQDYVLIRSGRGRGRGENYATKITKFIPSRR